MTVKIITDSCCDLPPELAAELGLEVLSLLVINEEREYRDQLDITPKDVYDGMREGKIYKTAQVPPHVFEESFERIAREGQSAIYLGFSSELSATFQSARMAKNSVLEKYPELDVELIDTKAASGGFGMIVYETAKKANEGASMEKVLETANFYIENIDHIFTVDDIEYLYRGGRVSKTSAVLGGMLNIKPVLEVKEGKLGPVDKVRGRQKALRRILELMEERSVDKDLSNRKVFIYHGDDPEAAERMREMIAEKFGVNDFYISFVGSVIGAHTGPGTISVFYSKRNLV